MSVHIHSVLFPLFYIQIHVCVQPKKVHFSKNRFVLLHAHRMELETHRFILFAAFSLI